MKATRRWLPRPSPQSGTNAACRRLKESTWTDLTDQGFNQVADCTSHRTKRVISSSIQRPIHGAPRANHSIPRKTEKAWPAGTRQQESGRSQPARAVPGRHDGTPPGRSPCGVSSRFSTVSPSGFISPPVHTSPPRRSRCPASARSWVAVADVIPSVLNEYKQRLGGLATGVFDKNGPIQLICQRDSLACLSVNGKRAVR